MLIDEGFGVKVECWRTSRVLYIAEREREGYDDRRQGNLGYDAIYSETDDEKVGRGMWRLEV